ncbi:MAG: protoporphyrinogen oxidase [Nitrospirae bacterium]|nr:protoporphyrinogen oxidase [Nitrospirota bacterium]
MRLTIIGGGISGLSLSYFLLEREPSLDIIILESEKRAGGKIWTDKANGFLCESGVNGFLDNKPKTLELAAELLLKPLRSNDASRRRFIYSEGKLHLLPESPLSFFTSNLISPLGRLRIIYEIFVPKGNKDDETLADFARRRLGREAYEKLIDPMASGIYAGDPEVMSLKSCFPRIHELEMNYGSLIRAMIKLKKVGPGPGGVLTSFYDGIETLIISLKGFLGDRVRLGAKVLSVEKKGDNYIAHLSDNLRVETEVLVIASPSYAASEMLRDFDRGLSSILSGISYPSLSVICLGFKKEKIQKSLDGFGFLVPNRERRKILGTLWDSSIFPNRAPEGYVLLRSMVGGVRASELAMHDENKLINIVMDELMEIMDIKAQPDFAKVYRHERAIPQYSPGHSNRLRTIDGILSKYRGLYLTGNAYRGISVNDCIENSYRLAGRIVEENL